jgi:anaerobic selenocysteine-containing dehydrogenase
VAQVHEGLLLGLELDDDNLVKNKDTGTCDMPDLRRLAKDATELVEARELYMIMAKMYTLSKIAFCKRSLRQKPTLTLCPTPESSIADPKKRKAPDWQALKPRGFGPAGRTPPALPDHWSVIEEATDELPFRLVTAPARHYLNSTFNETSTSIRRERRPSVMLHPQDASMLGVEEGDTVRLGNGRGEVRVYAECFDGLQRGVAIVESIWPNHAFIDGKGINVLTGADPVAPVGGAAFHDNRIWIQPV